MASHTPSTSSVIILTGCDEVEDVLENALDHPSDFYVHISHGKKLH